MDLFYFLQVDTTKVAEKVKGFESVGTTLVQGGWLMVPLALLFVIGVFFFFERFILLQKFGKIDDNFMNIIRDHVVTGNVTAARSLAKNTSNPVARMIDKGLQRIGKPIDAIEKVWRTLACLKCIRWKKISTSLISSFALPPCSVSWERLLVCSACSTASIKVRKVSVRM